MKHMHRLLLAGAALLAGNTAGFAEDWTQYRGPRGDGTSTATLPATMPASGPKRLWTASTPGGFSSFTVADGKVFTVLTRELEGTPSAVCVALDAVTGKELWAESTGVAKFQGGGDSGAPGNSGGDGPRSTPTVSGNRVYVYSADMVLHCLDAATGKAVWKKDIARDFHGKNIGWKCALSPVVDGELLFIAGGGPGEAMLAFNKNSGAVVWKTGDQTMTHATPAAATIHGVRQVIFLMQSGLVSVESATGKELWKFPFPYRTSTACSPVVSGDVVFVSAGYEIGGGACKVNRTGAGFAAQELWRVKGDAAVASLWGTPVCKDGFLYGMISFKKFGRGPLKCVDLNTGTVKWEQPGFGSGQVVVAGDRLVALADDGRVVIVEANPSAYKELAQFKGVEGKCWSTPALSNGRLYVRSTKQGACFDVSNAN